MAKGLDEIKKDVDTLTTAISRLDTASTGLARSFGEFGASGNTTWNIISRLSSGTGFWRLQNRIRAVSNVFQEYFNRQSEGMKSTLKSLDANLALAKSLDALKKERKNITDTPLYKMFDKDAESSAVAKKEAEKYYDTIIGKIEKEEKKRKKAFKTSLAPNMRERLAKGGMLRRTFVNPLQEIMRPYSRTASAIGRGGGRGLDLLRGKKGLPEGIMRNAAGRLYSKDAETGRVRFVKANGIKEKRAGFFKTQFSNIKEIFKFARMGTVFFAKFLLLFSIIALAIPFILKAVKYIRENFGKQIKDTIMKVIEVVMKAFNFIKKFIMNVISFYSALFRGDFKKAKDMLLNFFSFIWNGIKSLGKMIVKGIGNVFMALLRKIPWIGDKFASGGVVRNGGMSLVGEQGPELVRLPVGSRVFSNAESRGMSGTTNITVQVTGRVGASDQEIKDIARKVSREIGLQMNRTGATAVRF